MSKRTRDIDFHVYLNEEENQILENLCSRLRVNRSVLIRALILGKRLVEAPPVDYKQFIIELRRVGTNLTQMTFGFSRDDAGKFLDAYYDAKIFENDPFAKLDQTGVGMLMEMAVTNGKKVRPEMHCGICGEHGGDPVSVEFCHTIGLDYVSCSPFRVPIARLAAAQAAIKDMK